MTNLCPVCGYPDLDEPAYKGDPSKPMIPSLEICMSCGFQFGYDDDDQHITHEQWRQKWIENGMKWRGISIKPPVGWNPTQQLTNIGVDSSDAG